MSEADFDDFSRRRARELLKPLFARPCSPEERAVCDTIAGYIKELLEDINIKQSEIEALELDTRTQESAKMATPEKPETPETELIVFPIPIQNGIVKVQFPANISRADSEKVCRVIMALCCDGGDG